MPSLGPWVALATYLPCKGQGAEGALHGGFYVKAKGGALLFIYSCIRHEEPDCMWVEDRPTRGCMDVSGCLHGCPQDYHLCIVIIRVAALHHLCKRISITES